ncbi:MULTISPECIES: peptidoglycan D,D-transpeptidase FtsI family protein [Bacillaceae]|uniref:serine-type D-Ala-D-Ala carboxypeptidase n=1 Tax=Evansella alkalicola TaxID=745819 RepID=A0ABS6JV32_9BACI|nr:MULTISPECIES: penicillin-binding protein 2 [Bacillaceae]MBU9722443.1 penicillin-binding protein 2 [Bacillus alkalicola]
MKEKKTMKTHLPIRLNILFFFVFILFSALILRLGIVQIVQGQEFEEQVERTINISVPVEAPRGLMYDRNGNIVVDNNLLFTVTYTNRHTPPQVMLETAQKLNEFITVEPSRINERDLREYWGVIYPDEFVEKLPIEEAEELEMTDGEAHAERISRITERELESLSNREMEVFAIWREFTAGYNNLPHKVLRDITYEQAAQIMEHLDELPGVDIIRDSEREYIYGDLLSDIIGRIGQIPRDSIDHFLANGYTRNAEVGTSYLEAQYEKVLRGREGRLDNFMDSRGNFLRNPEINEGSRGNDLILTFDMEFQQRVENIVDELVEERSSHFIGDPDAYVVVMEPNTGDILAMAGYDERLREAGNFNYAFEMGSSIKGATVLIGYDTGVLPPGSTIFDRPVNLPSANPISSHRTLGYINDLGALEQSSNIYMIEVAMRLVGYVPGRSSSWGNIDRGYDTLRDYYHQFGLGVPTGLDVPVESAGINGGYGYPGNMLMLTFGQFDTYTPLQLAQYTATIANGGYRVAPRFVREIREPGRSKEELGPISQQVEPKILNKLDVDDGYIDRIQEGFRLVTYGSRGTARSFFGDAPYEVAGKTGTAQVTVRKNGVSHKANNQTFVAFAPFDEPEVAIAVVVPGVHRERGGAANTIARRVLDTYFDMKENRNVSTGAEDEEDDEDEDNEESED